ncbi:hypothetical protein BAE44_0001365 [Dichanthelium oligosanthes]|uniref:Uncharacterized protein n=1 Tax=Dichanthelium oligosanthes TaxID=888268 RepID=A0A1E5WJP0_9POAL|nr:hypothetical protein BAE44_0001365 [Dichanthelium oligosanthes]
MAFLGRSGSGRSLTENLDLVGSVNDRRSGFGDFSSHLSTCVG